MEATSLPQPAYPEKKSKIGFWKPVVDWPDPGSSRSGETGSRQNTGYGQIRITNTIAQPKRIRIQKWFLLVNSDFVRIWCVSNFYGRTLTKNCLLGLSFKQESCLSRVPSLMTSLLHTLFPFKLAMPFSWIQNIYMREGVCHRDVSASWKGNAKYIGEYFRENNWWNINENTFKKFPVKAICCRQSFNVLLD